MFGDYMAENGEVVGTFIIRDEGRKVGHRRIIPGTKWMGRDVWGHQHVDRRERKIGGSVACGVKDAIFG